VPGARLLEQKDPHPRGVPRARGRHPARTRWVALGAAVAVSLLTAGAHAFVRTRTDTTEMPFFRSSPQVTLEVSTPSDALSVTPSDVYSAARAAASAWSYPALSCTSLALTVAPGFADSQAVGYDGHNRIIMRTGVWARDPNDLSTLHDASQVAVTTVTSLNHPGALDDGQILDADIEVNEVDYQWAIIPDGPISVHDYGNAYDLASALTHEMGHFIGLAHTCVMDGDPVRYDEHGAVVPDCAMLGGDDAAAILAATMYPTMNPVDVSLRSLTDDDVNGACSLYPLMPTVTGGCDVSSSPPPATGSSRASAVLPVACGGLALLLASRRRRARR